MLPTIAREFLNSFRGIRDEWRVILYIVHESFSVHTY